ncbi:MAG: pseudouridine synthase [Luteibaculaceae bacterium]
MRRGSPKPQNGRGTKKYDKDSRSSKGSDKKSDSKSGYGKKTEGFKAKSGFTSREGSEKRSDSRGGYGNKSEGFSAKPRFNTKDGADKKGDSRGSYGSKTEGYKPRAGADARKGSAKNFKEFTESRDAADEPVKRRAKPSEFAAKAGVRPAFHQPVSQKEIGLTRLNKFLAEAGLGSRREADEIIKTGLVTVNGQTITDLGTKVGVADVVKYAGETLRHGKTAYLLLNKPKGYVTTSNNIYHRRTVGQLIKDSGIRDLMAVGKMDKETTGVLLLTNDGSLMTKLIDPAGKGKKIYHVHLTTPVLPEHIEQLSKGIQVKSEFIKADSIAYVDGKKSLREVGVEIKALRNSLVRSMFEQLGYKVEKLDRVFFCGLTKKGLEKGMWRYLSQEEVNFLKMI